MSLNRTYVWNVMTIWISREISLFNFKRHYILWPRIRHACKNLWPIEFLERFRCLISNVSIYYVPKSDIRVKSYDHLNFSTISVVPFQASWYIMVPNQASVWKAMTIWISRKVPLFNFERRDVLCARIGHPCKKLWPFEFLEHLNILCSLIGHPCEKLWQLEYLEGIRCSISSVSIYYVPESYIRVKSYDYLNFSRGSVVQFPASWYIMSPNRTAVCEDRTIWISREVPLLNFERHDI